MTAKPDSFWCPVCQKPFAGLKKHIVLKLADPDHAVLMTDKEKQRYYCSECDKFYKDLSLHRSVVHIKPFVCTEPDCEFACGEIQKQKRHLIGRHKLPVPDADAIANRTRVKRAKHTGRTITSRNEIRQNTAPSWTGKEEDIPPGGTWDTQKTYFYGPGLLYTIIFSSGGRETRYVGSTQVQTTSGVYWDMAKARLGQHATTGSDMAAAIVDQNYTLSVVKSWECIGRFALHALEAEMIWGLKGGAASGGYQVANGVLPTTRETLDIQLADDDHHRWITDDLIPDFPERLSPKTSRPTMGTDSSFQLSEYHVCQSESLNQRGNVRDRL